MSLPSDFPGASYDRWKTRSPDDDYPYDDPDDEDACDCEDFDEIDPVNARVQCCQCGRIWTRSLASIEADRKCAEAFERQMRWEHRLRHVYAFRRWLLSSTLDFRLRLTARVWRVKWARRWTRRFDLVMSDEEIPF